MAETKKREYLPSEEVRRSKAAWEQQAAEKPGQYSSAWQAQLDSVMDKILGREAFSYNLNGDALYRQYKDQAVRAGRMAMMDTMGQAAALTGGYANSYAQNAGQQAYRQQLDSLNDRIPELYALAMEQYDRQSQALRQQYELLSGRESADYSRYRDGVADWQNYADRLWDQYTGNRDFDYSLYRDIVSDEQWQAEFDENKRRYDQQWEFEHPTAKPAVVYRTVTQSAEPSKKTAGQTKKKTNPTYLV